MNPTRERRNGGRLLGVVIESDDVRSRKALQALSEVTRETFRTRGIDTSQWPADVKALLAGVRAITRVVRVDSYGDEHVFALADCGDFDVLFGVSSRRELNVPGELSGNLATNVLLDILRYPDPQDRSRPLYGQIGAEDLNRVWRLEIGAAHVQSHAREWDLIMWSRSDYLDYLIPGTSLMGTVRGNQSAEQATALVVNSSKHKAAAHRAGILKYALGQTHPLVSVNPATRQIVGYNQCAVDALREAVALLRSGASWQEAADAVGARIPAPQAQQEPDDDVDGSSVRTRAARNAVRAARGLPQLPLRFLADGSPNPDYRPETILDLNRPAERLQTLLLWGPSVPRRDARSIEQRIDSDLDGIHPDDSLHEFYTTGIYRRLVKDQTLSNSSTARYRWEALNLGPTGDGKPVLTHDDIRFLRTLRTGRVGTGSWGNNPLTGVFRVAQETPLFSRNGYLDPGLGTFKVRSGSTGADRGLRIWFEPFGAEAHSKECCAVGWVPNSEIGPAVAGMIVDALQAGQDLATFKFHHQALRPDPVQAAKQLVADVERRHEVTALRLADPDLSALTLNALKRELVNIEAQLEDAQVALAEAEATAAGAPTRHDDEFDITDLAQLAAVVGSGVQVPPHVAERAARLLRTFLIDPRMILEPATASIRVEALLVLPGPRGVLSIPVCATVANHSSDPWVAGVAGMWWARRDTPFKELMHERGLSTAPGSATRWREPIAARLLAEAAERGRPLRGINVARLVTRCNDAAALAEIRDAIESGEASEPVSEFLFDGSDVPRGVSWLSSFVRRS